MKIDRQMNWLKSEDFNGQNPLSCKVTDVQQVKGKFGMDTIIYFQFENLEVRCMSIYKQNLNCFIDKFGDETDNWKGKIFLLHEESNPEGVISRRIIIR